VLIEQPTTDEERAEAAEFCTISLQVTMPTILDKIDDRVANAYAAFPDRIYVVGSDGRISYKGLPGPADFNVPEAMAALEVAMEGGITPYGQEPGQARPFGRGGRGARGQIQVRQAGGQAMGVMDTDQDGQISGDEWQGEQDDFERFDTDSDGFLTMDELLASAFGGRGRGRGGSPQARFDGIDANQDGQISPDEFPGPSPMFATIDTNGDGALSAEELALGAGLGGRGARGGGPGARLQSMDANGDGQVSSEEFSGPEQMFRMLDSNSDGFLSADEMRARRGRLGEQP
jgi:Ca2+-binding EF-hand superfamily protein